MSSGTVSVIIPAFNVEHCLGRCLDSVRAQGGWVRDVVVVDDGSSDRTAEVASRTPDVTLIRQANRGQGAARNAGLERAGGDLVAFLDADDFWLPGFLAACVDFLERHSEAVAVSTGLIVRSWGGSEQVRPDLSATAPEAEPFVIPRFFEFWGEHDHVRTGSNVIRRSVVERVGPQRADLRVSEDLEYWALIATHGPWGFVPAPLWVGDSRVQASANWIERNAVRRRLCPTVEAWEERIVPRLQPEDRPHFERVRGRVAAAFALYRILVGNDREALGIVRRYGRSMPSNAVTRLLRLGAAAGGTLWAPAAGLLRVREARKDRRVRREAHA